MVLEKARLSLPERQVRWQALADARLALFGPDALIVPMAWQTHDTGTVVTTIGGQQVDFTYSQSQSVFDFDTPPSYLGPLGIPVINFNQSDEWLETPDAAFWNDTAGSSEPSYYWSCWVFVVTGSTEQTIWSKSPASFIAGKDWHVFIGGDEKIRIEIYDDSVDGFIGAKTSSLLGWHHFSGTKHDDAATAASVILYIDGVADRVDNTSGSYVAQEDGTLPVRIGAESDGGSPLGCPLAGGPLGPMFIAVGANAVPTPDAIKRDYQLGRAALGI